MPVCQATADYRLSSTTNALSFTFTATTDKATVVNMCNHTYWNLTGDCKSSIRDHVGALFCVGDGVDGLCGAVRSDPNDPCLLLVCATGRC